MWSLPLLWEPLHFVQCVLCMADFWLMHSLCFLSRMARLTWNSLLRFYHQSRRWERWVEFSAQTLFFVLQSWLVASGTPKGAKLCLWGTQDLWNINFHSPFHQLLLSLFCVLFYDPFTRPFFLHLASCRSCALVLALALYLILPYPFHVLLSITSGFHFTSHALCAGGCWLGLGSSIYGGVLRAADGMGSRRERRAVSSSCGLRIDDFQWKASALLTRGLILWPAWVTPAYICMYYSIVHIEFLTWGIILVACTVCCNILILKSTQTFHFCSPELIQSS